MQHRPPGRIHFADRKAGNGHRQQIDPGSKERRGIDDHLPRNMDINQPIALARQCYGNQRRRKGGKQTSCFVDRAINAPEQKHGGIEEEVNRQQCPDGKKEIDGCSPPPGTHPTGECFNKRQAKDDHAD